MTQKWSLYGLLSILLLGILLRYPFQGHMGGADSFYFAGLAGAWAQSPGLLWGTDPLALLGLSPLTRPAAYPMLLGALGIVTGLSPEVAMLFLSFALYVLGTIGVFLLGRKVRSGQPSVALVAALFFAVAPYSIRLTQWQATGRTLFMALFPFLAAFLVLAVVGKHRRIAFLLALLLVLLLFLSHRVAAETPLFLLALVIAVLLSRGTSQGSPSRRSYVIVALFMAAFGTLALGTVLGFIPTPLGGNSYTSGLLLTGSSPEIVLANFLLDYGSTLGLLAILGLVGLVVLLLRGARNAGETFLLIALLFTAPILYLSQYTPMLLLPFIAVFVGIGATRLTSMRRGRPVVASLLAILFIAAPFVSVAIVQNWASQGLGPLRSETVQTALFIRLTSPEVFVSNNWSGSYRIWVVAGGAPLAWADPPLILAGKLTTAQLEGSIVLPGGFVLVDDVALQDQAIETGRRDWIRLMSGDLESPAVRHILEKYDIELFIEDLNYVNAPQLSSFSSSVHQTAYCIYRNQQFALWQVG